MTCDWPGTERMRAKNNGSVDGTFTSLPFGDAQATTYGNDLDQYHFAGLDRDPGSYTDHAQFRQYSNVQGHWLSPDPYGGSYDITNPQSFNRYAYASNSPLSYVDPSGLKNCFDCTDPGGGSGDCWPYSDYGCSDRDPLLYDCYGPGGWEGPISTPGPRFKGYKDLDPERTMNEHLGLPAGMRLPTGDILDLFGIGSGTCEFGACGAGPMGFTDGQGAPDLNILIYQGDLWGIAKYFWRKALPRSQSFKLLAC